MAKTETFIRKIQPDPDGLDFDGLRREGIRLAQQISGDEWTDYNLHDPGVTILEQLCYGLTDLVYRTGFRVQDYLASPGGGLDFGRLALHRPDEIFSCGPVTENDYRKLILDAVPNVDNVWIRPHADGLQGLHRIHLQLNERVKEPDSEGARKAYADIVGKVYSANRNLCEDLAEVEIVGRVPYSLRGEIEIDARRDPAAILAEIYYECAQYLSPAVTVRSYAEMYKNGSSLEELFTGVATRHGYIADEELHPWRGHFSIQEMTGRIGRIDGVKNVRHLAFEDEAGNLTDRINLGLGHPLLSVACLRFPPPDGEIGVSLYEAGKSYSVSLRDVETEFDRLNYKSFALRDRQQKFDWVDALLPTAEFRDIRDYYSVQHHFPDAYGINAGGVPDTAPQERRAQALQLKAYLMFFEQIMANFLQNVQEIPRLFSLDEDLRQSCFHQVLGNDVIPRVESVYRFDAAGMEARLAALIADADDYGDRRNRFLDYLLGLYGEKFNQNSLRHFCREDADPDEEKIANKIALLKQIADVGRNRAAAFDYLKPSAGGENVTALKKKLAILLGWQADEGEFQVVEHILLRAAGAPAHAGIDVPEDFYGFRCTLVFPGGTGRLSSPEFRKLVEETLYLCCPAHIRAETLWLDAERMARFDALYGSWLAARRDGRPTDETDAVAGELIRFLLETGDKPNG